MNSVSLEIIVPVFNEGEKVVKLMKNFELHVRANFRVLFCYDDASDNIFDYKNELSKFKFEIIFIKNVGKGPLSAIKEGFRSGNSDCVIVYPADDFLNFGILDTMYQKFLDGSQIVVASRFIKGGSMNNCPLIKSILVRVASYTLYYLSSIPVKDASNGFRLFSRKLLNEVKIESQVGFAYSLELLAKCNRLKYKISEVPAKWEERSEGQSRFKVLMWLPQYLKWYIYGILTSWLKIKKL